MIIRLLLIALFFIGTLTGQAQEKTRILLIFDASNSMHGNWQGEPKIKVARRVLGSVLDSLEGFPNLELGLRVYGHQSAVRPDFQDCQDTKLEVPIGPDKIHLIKNFINYVDPLGCTPIANSLEAAAEDFPDTNARNVIILITDGIESCGNDPCRISKKLREKGISVKPFVIGMGIDLSYISQLECIGTFYDAKDPNSFNNIAKQVFAVALGNTTAQVDLKKTNGEALETDVTVRFYKAGTKDIMYEFIHTMNRKGNPDTLSIDPAHVYDVEVYTLPKLVQKNVRITPGTHNHIPFDAPLGTLTVKFKGSSIVTTAVAVVRQKDQMETLNHQVMGQEQRYIVGEYDLEVLTLPRTYFEGVQVEQDRTKVVTLDIPGKLYVKCNKLIEGQIFVYRNGAWEWVIDLDGTNFSNQFSLQPGKYKLLARKKEDTSVGYTFYREFKIYSSTTETIRI